MSADSDVGTRCPCGHWWVDHDRFGCLKGCRCNRPLLAARDAHPPAKDAQSRCTHRMAPDETNHPYWRFRCAICGLQARVASEMDGTVDERH